MRIQFDLLNDICAYKCVRALCYRKSSVRRALNFIEIREFIDVLEFARLPVPLGRAAAEATIAACAKNGSELCLIHHSAAEQLVSKLKGTMDRLPDYLDMIRQHGMVPGLSAHMPELVLYSDQNGYDVQTYIQIYNCAGFLMQVEVEGVRAIIENAKKPVMSIKPMAAGRVSPYVGLTFSFATLRPCDMVTVGAHTPEEVYEDVEIALAAIERRFPDMERRSSPNRTAVLGGAL